MKDVKSNSTEKSTKGIVENVQKTRLPHSNSSKRVNTGNTSSKNALEQENLEFEDPYGDDYDEDEELFDADYPEDNDEEQHEKNSSSAANVWIPGIHPIHPDEKLEYDPKCYEMLHTVMLDWSCLSFDIIPDSLGMNRSIYPHTAYIVAGTQADTAERNSIFVMKWSALHKTYRDSAEESDVSDDDDALEEDAKLDFNLISHKGAINRIRCCPQLTRLVATWSETGKVHIWDISEHLHYLDAPKKFCSFKSSPLFTTHSHSTEGFAMDWNPHKTGRFLTGDCNSNLFVWERIEGGWIVDWESPFLGHQKSVEDVQWKQVGAGIGDVFASACVDQALRIYDCRVTNRLPTQAIVSAHPSDINVLNWNPFKETLILTGDDDGCCKVWDLRFSDMPVAKMHWHKKPITSVGWNPTDEASFACSSYDNSVTFWDLSVENDDDFEISNSQNERMNEDTIYPDQLMFHHMGQQQISELHWHSQIPGVVITTAVDGFNIFKTCNI